MKTDIHDRRAPVELREIIFRPSLGAFMHSFDPLVLESRLADLHSILTLVEYLNKQSA